MNDICRVLYEGQKHRGNDAFGVVAFDSGSYYVDKWIDEGSFLGSLEELKYSEMLIHTRFPTSTDNVIESAHPFIVERGDRRFYFIHNGIINNSLELKAKHDLLGVGYEYKSLDVKSGKFNDSEALAFEIVDWVVGGCVGEVSARGSVAMIMLEQSISSGRAVGLYYYRNDMNPLTMLKTSGVFMLASEGLPDEVESGKMFRYDYATGKVEEVGALVIGGVFGYSSGWGVGGGASYGYLKSEYSGGVSDREWWEKSEYYDVEDNSSSSYYEALEELEVLAEDYRLYCDSVLDEDIEIAMGILEEINELVAVWSIPSEYLRTLGIGVGNSVESLIA